MRSGSILQFPFTKGLAEDSNSKAKPMASLKSGNNIRWVKDGTIGKRYASRTLSAPAAAVKRFIVRGDELAISTGTRIYSWDSTAGQWITGPAIPDVSLDWKTTVDPTAGVTTCDSGVLSNGHIVEAWVTGQTGDGNLYYQVRDIASDTIITPPTIIFGGALASIRLLVKTTSFVLLFMDTVGNLKAFTGSATTTLRTDAATATGMCLDACLIGNDFVVCYTTSGGGARLARCTFAATPSVITHAAVASFTPPVESIGIDGADGEVLYLLFSVSYGVSNAIKKYVADPTTLAQVVAVADLDTPNGGLSCVSVLRISPTQALAVWSYSDASGGTLLGRSRVYSFASNGTTSNLHSNFFLRFVSRPFLFGSKYYAFAAPYVFSTGGPGNAAGSDLPPMGTSSDMLLVEISPTFTTEPFGVVGKVDVNVAGEWCVGFVTSVTSLSSTQLYAMTPFQGTPSPTRIAWRQGARCVRLSRGADGHPDAGRNVEMGREAYVTTGGKLLAYDGAEAVGYSWPHPVYIDPVNTVANGASGVANASIANGTYLYNTTPERRSAVGILHRGPVGVPVSVDVTSANSNAIVTVAVATASAGRSSFNQGHYPIYRSESNGSVLYRVTVEPVNVFLQDTFNGDAYPISVRDTRGDSDVVGVVGGIALSERPQVYTDAGELEDVMPPAPYTLHLHKGRIGIITGDRREYWYTKDVAENPGIAPGFSPDQREIYPQDLVACASLDDKRVMFWRGGIYVVSGDGPTVAGTENRFTTPIALQVDVGCTNPRSVVTWPDGVMFEFEGDIFNLGRDLGVTWIGRDVRDTLRSYPTITSAVLVPSENEVRFTCNTADGTAGLILVHDYERHTWFTRTYPSSRPISDAVLFGGTYYWAASNTAEVRYEDRSTALDGGTTYVSSTVELADISPAGPVGWQRVRIVKPVGQSLSNHAMTVSVARDWSDSYEQTSNFAAGSAVTTIGPYLRAEVAVTVQRRQSIRVKFTDAAPSNTTAYPLGNGRGFQMEGIALLVQPKPGMPRDTASRRGG